MGAASKLSPDYMREKRPSGYDLSRAWFDFVLEATEDIKPHHYALYFFIVERANRSGWKKLVDMPTDYSMKGAAIGNFTTYKNCLLDLEKWGFIAWEVKNKNQYGCNKVRVCFDRNAEAPTEANEVPRQKSESIDQSTDQSNTQSIDQSTEGIYKPIKPINLNKPIKQNTNGVNDFSEDLESEKIIPLQADPKNQESQKKEEKTSAQKEEIQEADILEEFPFEDFWNLYDKKIDKPDCEKAWKALKDRQKEEIMLHHLPKYVATSEKKFRKDPIRYLRKNAWENEIIEPTSNQLSTNKQPVGKYDLNKVFDRIYGK